MSGIFAYIYPKNCPNVGKYSIHGASGIHYHRNNIADSLIFLLLTSCYRKIPHVTCDLDLLGVADPEAPPPKNDKSLKIAQVVDSPLGIFNHNLQQIKVYFGYV